MSKKIDYFLIAILIFLFLGLPTKTEAAELELTPSIGANSKFPASPAGLQELLWAIYQTDPKQSYTIQLEGDLDLTATTVGTPEVQENPTLETINFTSVPNSLTFKGIDQAVILSLPESCFFGQALQLNQLTLQASKIYGNGHPLVFESIQHLGKTELFGGSNHDLVGDPKIIFNQVTGGDWQICGGNELGNLTGTVETRITNLTGNLTQLCGGSLRGTIFGNVTTEINGLNGALAVYYGGGIGADGEPATVNGTISNQINGASTNFVLGNYYGGVAFGKTGPIQNRLNGVGNFSTKGDLIGGSQTGEILGIPQAITTQIDTSQFLSGERNFVGGNQFGGVITGAIDNQLLAGSLGRGSFMRIDGAGGMDIKKASLTNSVNFPPSVELTDPLNVTSEEAAYDQLTAAERFSMAREKTAFYVAGDVTTRLLGGCVSDGAGRDKNICGAGFAGLINGKVRLVLGENSLVYSKRWGQRAQELGINPNFLPDSLSAGSNYGFNVAAGGGDNKNNWENTLYVKGTTQLVIKQALVNFAYGGNFSGILDGTSEADLAGGQVSQICGAGQTSYRIYGDSSLKISGGKVETYAVAGGRLDRRLIGNLRTEISGGEFDGQIAATFGANSNHLIDGNAATIIIGGHIKKGKADTQIIGGVANEGMISGNVSLVIKDAVELETGISISAARPKKATQKNSIGGVNKQVSLEIATTKAFSEIELLGDGGTAAKELISPQLDLTVNAPNGHFSLIQGMIQNSYAGRLLHEVVLDVQAAGSIGKIIGSGDPTFSNRLIANSTAEILLQLGASQKELAVEEIYNFTQATVLENSRVSLQTMKNAYGATNENFATHYHQFGELTLSEGACLAVNELKTGSLAAAKNAELHSPAEASAIHLRKLDPTTKLTWRLLNEKMPQKVQGDYFDQQKGFAIMQFAGNEGLLTPTNFIGFDTAGQVYTGDTNGEMGLAVAATIIDYQAVDQQGKIIHDLPLQPNNQPLPLKVWGSGDEYSGELIIPGETKLQPTVHFIGKDHSSFLKAEIHSSDGTVNQISESSWQPIESYYYQVSATYMPTLGTLKLVSVPSELNFGQQSIGQATRFYPKIKGELIVEDTRQNQQPWQLTLQADTSEVGEIFFQEAETSYPLNEEVLVFNQTGSLRTAFDDWNQRKGIFLTVPQGRQKLGKHALTFHWRLTTKVE
ncbi:hypothetical protein ACFFH2_13165 [Enterococcus devriesei]|uniref:WxL domain-containing protein n=1 Tax=Enterococcus devriesei TaxID=319970 RepID=A0A1L8SR46_9ENTE|nr:hypothetical protein [Enterococcus devriesei]OJG34569.1 hypothetical protein RV00_GL000789 [Enterococcus devriesei]